MIRRSFPAAAAILVLSAATATGLLGSLPGVRPAAAAAASGPTKPNVKFEDYRLPNGLRVILAPDHAAPIVSMTVTYNVGSRDEKPGRTGFAHLFEHMMFQGSKNVGKGEHFQLISDNGGSFNGTTNEDRTNYFETVPANELETILFLESDRMRSLDISQANLDNQREVVKEEKRQRVDNVGGGAARNAITEASYASFAYKHPTIGSMDDLNAATLDDVRSFFKTYYAPNNAAIAITGDFNPKQAKQLIEKYFGPIPKQPTPPPVQANEPLHRGERRVVVKDPTSFRRQFTEVYTTVPGNHPDFAALDLLSDILGGGRTSRLYSSLVEPRKVQIASAGLSSSRGVSMFRISASPLGRTGSMDDLEKQIGAEITRIQTEGVTADELKRAQRREQVNSLRSTLSMQARSQELSADAVFYNDPGHINTYIDQIFAVTPDDIKRVARQYLTSDNRAVVTVEPATPPADPNGGGEDPNQ